MGESPTHKPNIIIYNNKKETMPQYLGPISATFDAGLTFKKMLNSTGDEPCTFEICPNFEIWGAVEDSDCVKMHYKKKPVDADGNGVISGAEVMPNASAFLGDVPLEVKLKKTLTPECDMFITLNDQNEGDDGTSTKAEFVCQTNQNNEITFGVKSSSINLSECYNTSNKITWFGSCCTDVNQECVIKNDIVKGNTKFTAGFEFANGSFNDEHSFVKLGLLSVEPTEEAYLNELSKCKLDDFKNNKDCLPNTKVMGGQISLQPRDFTQGWDLELYSLTNIVVDSRCEESSNDTDIGNFVCHFKIKEDGSVTETIVNSCELDTEYRTCSKEKDCVTDYCKMNFKTESDSLNNKETWLSCGVGCRIDYEGFAGYYGNPDEDFCRE
jgi:hypothetical protein